MKLLSLLSLFLFSLTGLEDDHSPAGSLYAFYHFSAPEPDRVVAAMDKFWDSGCGNQYPADVGLSQEVFNGSYQSTHFVINTFQSVADQETAAEIMRSCPAVLEFQSEMAEASVVGVRQYLGFAPIDENDWGQDSTFSKFDIVVQPQDQAPYAAAYDKMMSKVAEDTDVKSYGLGVVGFGRDKFTHWVWTGASSITELDAITRGISSHPAFAEFNQAVAEMRTVVNTTQLQILKNYQKIDKHRENLGG